MGWIPQLFTGERLWIQVHPDCARHTRSFEEHGLHASRAEGMDGCSRVVDPIGLTFPQRRSGPKLSKKIETVAPIRGQPTTDGFLRLPRIAPTPARGVYSEPGRPAGSAGAVAFLIGAGSAVGEAEGRPPRISDSASRCRMRISRSSQEYLDT